MPVEHLQAVPHLTTALNGPLLQLESLLLAEQTRIEAWLRGEWRKTPAPFYASVDLRNAGFKIAPVDTNLFPAGFNNLNPAFLPLCIQAMQAKIEQTCPTASNILLIAEDHTRNPFYLESLATLRDIIHKGGYRVRIGAFGADMTGPRVHRLGPGRELTIDPLSRQGDKLQAGDFVPCLIILNNDLISGVPPLLRDLDQPITPPPDLGWALRLKSEHFRHYRRVVEAFGEQLGIDPWLIKPLYRHCEGLDFLRREGEHCLARQVETLLEEIGRKYDEYGVDKQPFVVIKADAGTYGMGIMSVTDPAQVRNLNRRQRTRMSSMKGGGRVDRVILQEGVYTFETWGEAQSVAEPVVYMIDRFVVGGFYRVHTERGQQENLNAPGMHFQPLAFAESCNNPDEHRSPDAEPNRFYTYGVIARLALLAAAREMAALHTGG